MENLISVIMCTWIALQCYNMWVDKVQQRQTPGLRATYQGPGSEEGREVVYIESSGQFEPAVVYGWNMNEKLKIHYSAFLTVPSCSARVN